MHQDAFQAWGGLRFLSCRHIDERRYELIMYDLLQVDNDNSEGFQEPLDGNSCCTTHNGRVYGESSSGSSG